MQINSLKVALDEVLQTELITVTQAGDMASSLHHHTHSRCILKYSLFMFACLHITSIFNYELKSFHSNTTYYLYSPIWKNIAQLKCLRSNSSTGLLITPTPHKLRSNTTATKFTVRLCIILSGDIQINPGPSKCNSCKKKH